MEFSQALHIHLVYSYAICSSYGASNSSVQSYRYATFHGVCFHWWNLSLHIIYTLYIRLKVLEEVVNVRNLESMSLILLNKQVLILLMCFPPHNSRILTVPRSFSTLFKWPLCLFSATTIFYKFTVIFKKFLSKHYFYFWHIWKLVSNVFTIIWKIMLSVNVIYNYLKKHFFRCCCYTHLILKKASLNFFIQSRFDMKQW